VPQELKKPFDTWLLRKSSMRCGRTRVPSVGGPRKLTRLPVDRPSAAAEPPNDQAP
jgi:hypothetical protein